MKKLLITGLLLMLTALLVLTGCGGAAPTSTTTATGTTPAPTFTFTQTPTMTQPSITITPTFPTGGTQPAPTMTFTQPPATTTVVPMPTITTTTTITAAPGQPLPTIGLATGGAKDVANFRVNIENGYLPLPTDITYEGLFYDYYFDTGFTGTTRKLYAPSYTYAVTRDPLSGQTEYYMAVGLNSGMTEADFARKKLNLVIVLDTSGSMGEQYTKYYYDASGVLQDPYADEGLVRTSKMQSATSAVVSILDQLTGDDVFSIVTFNQNASVLQPMARVRNLDMNDVRNRVFYLNPGGSTNLSAGVRRGTEQFYNAWSPDSYEYENRMIVITDAQPNTGDISAGGMFDSIRDNAASRVYTTFIGVGVDFNSTLIEAISKVKGANYYSMHSPREFRTRIHEEFDFMVTPLVFDLRMDFSSNDWRIEKVFGSPQANEATGNLMTINTLFPARSAGGQNKGGIVLLKLQKTSSRTGEPVYLTVSYEDRNGHRDSSEQLVLLENRGPEYFENDGIRKAVLLTRYAAMMKNWLYDEYDHWGRAAWEPAIREDTGIPVPVEYGLGPWERQSHPLTVSHPYEWIMTSFRDYFSSEMNAIHDYTLEQEMDILAILCRFP